MKRTKLSKLPKSVHFQAITWNVIDSVMNDDIVDGELVEELELIIYVCGVDSDGNTIYVKITGFTPYFYVQIPETFSNQDADRLFKSLKNKLYKESYGLVDYHLVHKHKAKPFLAGRSFKLLKLNFKTEKSFKKCKYMFSDINQEKYPIKVDGVSNRKYEAFDSNIEHITRFFHITEVKSTGWIKINKFTENIENNGACINIVTHCDNIIGDSETNKIAPKTIFSWDIETLPENTEEFPNPDLPNDIICQISVVLNKYGTGTFHKYIFTNRPCNPIEGVTVIEAVDEENLLKKYCKFFKDIDPDTIIGYNTWGFDDKYVWKRCKKHGVDTSCFSRIFEIKPDLVTKELTSSAYGNNEFIYISYPGRETIDLLVALRREHKLESYSLNNVSEEFLGQCGYFVDAYTVKIGTSEMPKDRYNIYKMIRDSETPLTCECVYKKGLDEKIWTVMSSVEDVTIECEMLHREKIITNKKFSDKKVDLPYRILFEKLKGDPADIAECAEYCIQDSVLPLKIVLKLNIIPNYTEMAKATYVPTEWLLFRGQQCKVFSLFARLARILNFVIPIHNKFGPSVPFKGATVLTANTGIYYDPVAGLDFASLYPSIMIAYNMCYSTFIEDAETLKYVIENNIPYKTIEWDEIDEDTNKNVHHSYSFVQYEDEKGNVLERGVRGILPEILLELWKGRKATKKLMKTEKDPFTYAVLNGRQLAEKVTMNSIYGFTGADNGILPLKAIAASVTATGRKMIEKTSEMAREEFGAFVVYGDSIPGYEIITVKDPFKIRELPVEKFAEQLKMIPWEAYRGFKVDDLEIKNKYCKNIDGYGYQTWTHDGYKPIKKIIRHNTTKKLYRITAMDAHGKKHQVTVTEGHSLIDHEGNLLSAESAKIGDKLFNYR